MLNSKQLRCPHCQAEGSDNFMKEGFKWKYQKKVQRYRCKCCSRLFNES